MAGLLTCLLPQIMCIFVIYTFIVNGRGRLCLAFGRSIYTPLVPDGIGYQRLIYAWKLNSQWPDWYFCKTMRGRPGERVCVVTRCNRFHPWRSPTHTHPPYSKQGRHTASQVITHPTPSQSPPHSPALGKLVGSGQCKLSEYF